MGKAQLYSAASGIHPDAVVPVALDVGCDNSGLRNSPEYTGMQLERLQGGEYEAFVDEFHSACQVREQCTVMRMRGVYVLVVIEYVFPEVHAFMDFGCDSRRMYIAYITSLKQNRNDPFHVTALLGLAQPFQFCPCTGVRMTDAQPYVTNMFLLMRSTPP